MRDAFVQRAGESTRLSHFIFPRGCYGDEAKAAAKRALTSTDVAQPALGAVEAGLLRLLYTFGLKPDMAAVTAMANSSRCMPAAPLILRR